MKPLDIVFFGTHQFATALLQGLIEHPGYTIQLVITQPDQPVGRKHVLTAPETKILAQKHGIPVAQPTSLKHFDFPIPHFDLSIVIEYGRIIPQRLLSIPKYQTINIHPSLLPQYRGPTPIQFALLKGQTTTGVTIMQMDATMDTGPILLQKKCPIEPSDTFLTLREKLIPLALESLFESIPPYVAGTLSPTPQTNTEATYCTLLSRADGKINWNQTAEQIYNQFRAFTPWPGIWTLWGEKRLKLLDIKPRDTSLTPGQVHVQQGHICIGTTNGSLEVLSLQIEGKSAMDAKTFLQGHHHIHESLLKSD